MALSREDLVKEICGIIAYEMDFKLSDVKEDSKLDDDLGADSLDAVEIVMVIEEKYNIDLDDEEVEGIRTVADIVNLVEENI